MGNSKLYVLPLGRYHFLPGGGGVCLWTPVAVTPRHVQKKSRPLLCLCKFCPSPLTCWKKPGPPQTDGPLQVKKNDSLAYPWLALQYQYVFGLLKSVTNFSFKKSSLSDQQLLRYTFSTWAIPVRNPYEKNRNGMFGAKKQRANPVRLNTLPTSPTAWQPNRRDSGPRMMPEIAMIILLRFYWGKFHFSGPEG